MRKEEPAFGKERLVPLIEEFLDVVQTYRSPNTYKHYKKTIPMFKQWCCQNKIERLYQLDRKRLRQYIQHLNSLGLAKDTVWSYSSAVRAFLNWCVNEEILPTPIYRKGDFPSKPNPKPKPLTVDEVNRLLEAAETARYPWIAARDRAMIYVLLHSGIRRGELLQMKVGDVDRMMSIVIQKKDRPHTIYLNTECTLEIRRYLRLYMREMGCELGPDEPLWRSTNGKPMTEYGVQQVFKRLSARSGVHVYCHRLRQTSATLRLSAGASTELVRTALGHTEERSILHYVRLAQEDVMRLMDETSPLKALKPRNKRP
jgi:site-specific recombinase XerD